MNDKTTWTDIVRLNGIRENSSYLRFVFGKKIGTKTTQSSDTLYDCDGQLILRSFIDSNHSFEDGTTIPTQKQLEKKFCFCSNIS